MFVPVLQNVGLFSVVLLGVEGNFLLDVCSVSWCFWLSFVFA